MPELPEVEAVRRTLAPVMTRAVFRNVVIRRPDLRIPFPPLFTTRLRRRTVTAMDRRGKYLLATLSSGETLLMHLGMSGSFHVDRHSGHLDTWIRLNASSHDHVIFQMSSGAIVTFNDPRRFGFMDLVPAAMLAMHPTLSALGPEPLSPEFDALALAQACRRRKTSLKVALLDQRVVAGLGNIYVSEALHRARLSPERIASTIATGSGLPRPTAYRLTAAIKQILAEALDRQSAEVYRASRFRVYDREGRRCRTAGCSGAIRRLEQAGRSTFYCARCQR